MSKDKMQNSRTKTQILNEEYILELCQRKVELRNFQKSIVLSF